MTLTWYVFGGFMSSRLYYAFLLSVFMLFSGLHLFGAEWEWNIDNTNNTFSGTEVLSGSTIDGYTTQLPSGFFTMTVQNGTGEFAPAPGTEFTFLNSPGFGVFTESILTNEIGISPGLGRTSCPTTNFSSNTIKLHWNMDANTDFRNPAMITFGKFNWDIATNTASIYGHRMGDFQPYNANGNPIGVYNVTCQNGFFRYYKTSNGALVGEGRTGANKTFDFFDVGTNTFIAFGQDRITTPASLQGGYVGYLADRATGTVVSHVAATVDTTGNITIQGMNPDTGLVDSTTINASTTFQQFNFPYDGLMTGVITERGVSTKIACGVYHLTMPITIACVAPSPKNESYPYSFVLVQKLPLASCRHRVPVITLSPTSATRLAGATADYTMTVSNRDTAGCSSSEFALSTTQLPSGWPQPVFSTPSLIVAPGKKGTVNVSVTSKSSASNGSNTVKFKAVNVNDSSSYDTVSATYTVATCSKSDPRVTVNPSNQDGNAGQMESYSVTIKNNDSSVCASAAFGMTVPDLPTDWTASFSQSTVTLAPGTSTTIILSVTSDPGARRRRTYRFHPTATNNANANYSSDDSASYYVQ